MKNRPLKHDFQDRACECRDTLKSSQKKTHSSTKAVKTMAQQPIKPPARVWDKIAAILDEQDNRRTIGEGLIANSFGLNNSASTRRKVF